MSRIPNLQSMVLCDSIVRDEITKKLYLLGTFTNLWVPKPDTIYPRPIAIYLAISDAQGEYDLTLKIRHTDTREIWHDHTFKVNIANPLVTAEVNVMIGGIKMRQAGKIDFELYANGELLGMRQVMVSLSPPKRRMPPQQPPNPNDMDG